MDLQRPGGRQFGQRTVEVGGTHLADVKAWVPDENRHRIGTGSIQRGVVGHT